MRLTQTFTLKSLLPVVMAIIGCATGTFLLRADAADADTDANAGLLLFTNGDYISGKLEGTPSEAPDHLGWKNPFFESPFSFSLQDIDSFSVAKRIHDVVELGEHVIHFGTGDRVYGSVTSLGQSWVTVRRSGGDEMRIARDSIRRIDRWNDGKAVVFNGPGKLDQWETSHEDSGWGESTGKLETRKINDSIFRDVELPDSAEVEVELSWTGKPNFVLEIGSVKPPSVAEVADNLGEMQIAMLAFGGNAKPAADETNRSSICQLAVWGDDLVLIRELTDEADVAVIGKWSSFNGKLQLTVRFDSRTSSVMALSPQGEMLGIVEVPQNKINKVYKAGFSLTNIAGSVGLASLRVLRSPGQGKQADVPRDVVDTSHDVFLLENDKVIRGRWNDVGEDRWVVDDQETQYWINPREVVSVQFGQRLATKTEPVSEPSKLASPDNPLAENRPADSGKSGVTVQLVGKSGAKVSGVIERFTSSAFELRSKNLSERFSIPITDVLRMTVVGRTVKATAAKKKKTPTLKTNETSLKGVLVAAEGSNPEGPLRFATHGSSAVALSNDFAGRLIYRKPPSVKKVVKPSQVPVPVAQPRGLWGALARTFGSQTLHKRTIKRSVYLRSGEVFEGEVKSINKEGVIFKPKVAARKNIPHSRIRAVLMKSSLQVREVTDKERERLLTVPRKRKNSPPTHVLIAKNGDVMRCRLLSLSEDEVVVESKLETIVMDRSILAQIIWLEPVEPDAVEPDVKESKQETRSERALQSKGPLQIRARMRDGSVISMLPSKVSESKISGTHELFNEVEVPLSNVWDLTIGRNLDLIPLKPSDGLEKRSKATKLVGIGASAGLGGPYDQWKLQNAPEPILADDGGDGSGGQTGLTSSLVGQEAPELKLDQLDGEVFKVSNYRGKVLILDFWASWCGPCIQAMPVIEETVAEFDASEVALVTINLSESPETARKALARMKIDPTVALDIDGVAAVRYQADAIPETVVIDPEGKVRRVFVGGGPRLADQLRNAIEESVTVP